MFGLLELPKGFKLCSTYEDILELLKYNPEELKDLLVFINSEIVMTSQEEAIFNHLLVNQRKTGFSVIILYQKFYKIPPWIKYLIDCKIKITAIQEI